MPYTRVLIGADGTPEAAHAVTLGARLAADLGLPAVIVTAWEGHTDAPDPLDYEWAVRVSAAAAAEASDCGVVDVSTHTPAGDPAAAFLELTEADPAALPVLGGASLSSRKDRILGSTANHLSHNCAADLLFALRPLSMPVGAFALATDGSAPSHIAVAHGLELAVAVGATPTLVTAAKDDDEGARLMMSAAAQIELAHPGLEFARMVLPGLLAGRTLSEASGQFDLLAIGNRGMTGRARLRGSVASRVTHAGVTNLLLVNSAAG